MVSITGGHLVVPLDDTYIHFQFARQLSRGSFFKYTPVSGFSSGSTSLLYPALLAPFFWIGFGEVKILLVSFSLGTGFLALSAVLIFLIAKEIAEERVGMLAALLFILNGNMAWNFLSGMETGLFATLILGAVYCIARWGGERRGSWLRGGYILLCLASLTRPEGLIILGIVFILTIFRSWRVHGAASLWAILSFVPYCLYLVLVKLQTGHFATSGLLAKSVSNAPYYTFWEKIAKLADNFALILGGYYHNISYNFFPDGTLFPASPAGALYPFLLFPPAAFILALGGVILGGARETRNGTIGPILAISVILLTGISSVTNSEVVTAHYFRYLSPFQPLFFILVALGVSEISKIFENINARIFKIASAILIILIIPSVFFWAYIFGENCNDLFEQHRRTSWWIKDTTPKDAIIGVTDTGIIGYFSERGIYDFVGLTTPNQAHHWRQGLGSAFERLEHLPPEKLPDYIVSFPFVWGEDNFLGTPVHNAPLLKNITTMSNDFVVYKQDWSLLHSGDLPTSAPGNSNLADSLDVADIQNEIAHNYTLQEARERPVGWAFPNPRNFFHKAAWRGKSISDGGRSVSLSESFRVQLSPGKPVRMIWRTETRGASSALVFFNGKEAGHLTAKPGREKMWQEPSLRIPKEYVTNRVNRVTILFDRAKSRVRNLHSYHYWFYQ